jgi:predicted Zn-dependent protease with MMP-like domain
VADFDEHVRRALDSLPDDLREAMSNVAVVVEEENPEDPDLYGLYTGIALTDRTSSYGGVAPDTIAIYRRPLVEDFGYDPDRLEHEIRVTVLHEIGHHFGLDEERLRELGWG